jgi:hypothetical protein
MTRLLGKLQLVSLVVILISFCATLAWAQGTVQISTDPFDNPGSQHMTEVEPHVFSFGSTVVAAFQQGRYHDGGCSDIGFATSLDNGVSWQHGSLPGLTIFVGGDRYLSVSDTAVAYNAAFGLWLIESLPVGGDAAIFVSRSADGVNWDFPITANFGGGGAFYDKPWITCDNNDSSSFFGNCYIEWDSVFEGDLILMIASTDGGATWSAPLTTADGANGLGGQPLVLPNGRVVVPFRGFDGIGSFISDDGGASWSASVEVSPLSEHGVAGDLRSPSLPSAAIDGDGTIYVAWHDCRFRPSCRANDIVISTSSDGLSWSSPLRVPTEDASGPGDFFLPGLGANRNTFAPNVSLALVYYHYPQANCSQATCQLIGGFITSSDGGQTWSAPIDLTPPMALDWLPETSSGLMVGDYFGTDFTDDGVPHPIFAAAAEPMGQFLESMFSTSVDSAERRRAEVAVASDTARVEETAEPSGLRIVAPSYRVNIGAVMQLRANGSSNQGAPISWSIEEGGAGGTVSETGLYRSPFYPGVYHIVASDGLERARIELRVFTVR